MYVSTCHNLLLSSLQTLMSAMEQTHVHQMETVSIQMVPLHVTVPLAMSWIPVDRGAPVSPPTYRLLVYLDDCLNICHMLNKVSTL